MTALSPVLSAQLLLNADAIVDLLGQTATEEECEAVAAALRDLPDDAVPAFLSETARLCLAADPRVQELLDTLAERQEVRGGDPEMLSQAGQLWDSIRDNPGPVILVALLLRMLASNTLKLGGFQYDGGSVFSQMAEIIKAIRGGNAK
ncbi:MAG: hypothetical protein HQL42_20135 [Alphaproteobacteria bacterium]|nr:hypothetical protein [Alphaproteobacteria bacterium]